MRYMRWSWPDLKAARPAHVREAVRQMQREAEQSRRGR